jgi:hypothetical protein
MRAAQPRSEPQLLLPPLLAVAPLVTALTSFMIAAIVAARMLVGDSEVQPGVQGAQGPATTPIRQPLPGETRYPYSDPTTIGLY